MNELDERSWSQKALDSYNAQPRTDDIIVKAWTDSALMKSGAKVLRRFCRHTTWEDGAHVNYPSRFLPDSND